MDRAWLAAGHVVAQAVELAGTDALRERQQVTSEHAAPERWHRQFEGLRRDGDLGRTSGGAALGGKPEQVASAHRPLTIAVTSGASCPDATVDQVIQKLLELTKAEQPLENVLETLQT